MRLISRLRGHCFCAFCRSRRRVYLKKHVDLTNVLAAGLLSSSAAWALWASFDPRAVLIFCLVISVAELMVYLRWRLGLICRMCGFDPIVYKRSPEQAARLVQRFFAEQVDRPGFQLSQSPLLELQRRRREMERTRMRLRSAVVGPKVPVVDPRP